MARIVTINGVDFEIINPITVQGERLILAYDWFINARGKRSITDAYKKPSTKKVSIYESWRVFFSEIECTGYTVLGSNCNMFSVGAIDVHGNYYYITKSHNYYIPCTFKNYQLLLASLARLDGKYTHWCMNHCKGETPINNIFCNTCNLRIGYLNNAKKSFYED